MQFPSAGRHMLFRLHCELLVQQAVQTRLVQHGVGEVHWALLVHPDAACAGVGARIVTTLGTTAV